MTRIFCFVFRPHIHKQCNTILNAEVNQYINYLFNSSVTQPSSSCLRLVSTLISIQFSSSIAVILFKISSPDHVVKYLPMTRLRASMPSSPSFLKTALSRDRRPMGRTSSSSSWNRETQNSSKSNLDQKHADLFQTKTSVLLRVVVSSFSFLFRHKRRDTMVIANWKFENITVFLISLEIQNV